jgi:diguanylate cyclase (GGDEF)-like protein
MKNRSPTRSVLIPIKRQKIESMRINNEKSPVSKYVTVSIGITSVVPHCNSTYEELIEMADRALYLAKSAGKNELSFFPE